MSVLVVLQQNGTALHPLSLQAITAGRQLAATLSLPVCFALLGSEVRAVARTIPAHPSETIYLLQHPALEYYTPEAFTIALQTLLGERAFHFLLFPHTYQVRDYAPKLAARFGSSLISDVIGIISDQAPPRFVRPIFLGKLHAEISTESNPAFISVQAGAFRSVAPESARTSATMEEVHIDLQPADIKSHPEPPFKTIQSSVDLTAAKTIVSAGRGVRQKEDLSLVEALAVELRAEMAASRPLCDNGWFSMDRLVGSSGQTVSPDLYVAVGISGAIQHLLGMKGAKTLVAINNDPGAPIFDHAHYGIVGDLRAVLPALVEELRRTKL